MDLTSLPGLSFKKKYTCNLVVSSSPSDSRCDGWPQGLFSSNYVLNPLNIGPFY